MYSYEQLSLIITKTSLVFLCTIVKLLKTVRGDGSLRSRLNGGVRTQIKK